MISYPGLETILWGETEGAHVSWRSSTVVVAPRRALSRNICFCLGRAVPLILRQVFGGPPGSPFTSSLCPRQNPVFTQQLLGSSPVTEGKAVGVPQTPPSLAEPLPHKPWGTLLLPSWGWGASGRRPAAPSMTTAATTSHIKPGLAGSKMRG